MFCDPRMRARKNELLKSSLSGYTDSMHVIFRTLLTLLAARRRPRISLFDTSVISLRALPTDVDLFLHINNGQYFSLFDLGRHDLMARSGMTRAARRRRWRPVVQSEQITFRKSVTLMTKCQLYTRMIGMDEKCMYIEHRIVVDGEIFVRGVVAGRIVGPEGPVSNEELVAMAAELGEQVPEDFAADADLVRWREESALPSSRRPAPNPWQS